MVRLLAASLLLWRDVVPDRAAPVARRRRRNLSLLLRIAAVVLATLAGADPALTASRPAERTLYALVDRSPSMGADGRRCFSCTLRQKQVGQSLHPKERSPGATW